MKVCPTCKVNKKNSDFYKHYNTKTKLTTQCKICHVKRSNEKRFHTSYGITYEQKNLIVLQQNNVCAICRQPMKKPNMDHCHTTKKVRGVLCHYCNTGLGNFKDSPELLRNAAIYLEYYAKQHQSSPLPTGSHQEGQDNPPHGFIHGAGPREDGDGAHHHLGGTEGDNADSGAQTSSGNSMGSGVSEVGSSETLQGGEGDGDTQAKADSIRKFVEHLHNQSREFGVAVGMWENVRLPNHRRELEVQGSINEAIQSTQKTFEKLQEALDPNWNSEPTGTARFVVSGRYTGLGAEAGDKSNPISGQVHGPGPEE